MRSLLVLCCAGAAVAAAHAQSFVVSPNFRAAAEGAQNSLIPFAAPAVLRYQQVFDGASLNAVSGMRITQIAFRLDGGVPADYQGGFQYSPLVVKLSTTTAPVDGLSTTMNANVGSDVQTVYNGPYTLPTLHASATPRPFDMVINLQSPFLYSGGNLLLEVEGPIGPATGGFLLDAEMTQGDAVSRVFQTASGFGADTAGLVTRFTGVSTGCYANCDGGTTEPVLNVNDFICFQWQFAGGTNYANCDGSTTPPVLNVNDFLCFQNRFAQGCQ